MKKTILFICLLVFCISNVFSQESGSRATRKADVYFDDMSYVAAAEAYKALAEENPSSYVLKRLGDSYYYNADFSSAAKAYSDLFSNYQINSTEHIFRYAQSLRSVGSFAESDQWMEKFHQLKDNDQRGINFTANKAYLETLIQGDSNYKVENLRSINTKDSDFGVTEFGNRILFSSPDNRDRLVKLNHTRNEKVFLDFFEASKDDLTSSKIDKDVRTNFSNEINSAYHESSVAFMPDNETLYFTRNNYIDGKFTRDQKGYNNLKIYKATLEKGKWTNIESVSFNNDEYSVGHPSINKEGTKMYFISDMPGGYGATDIYVTNINSDGSFGTIKNLGPTVNTEGREMFPFIATDDVLYFSSDGHFGIGGLDVFSTTNVVDAYTKPLNLKSPINSKSDDFAFSMNPSTKEGYLSSNRSGGEGDDDIYKVSTTQSPTINSADCNEVVSGIVRDQNTNQPIQNARLMIEDSKGFVVKDTLLSNTANFSFNMPCNRVYTVTASKDTYRKYTHTFSTTKEQDFPLDLPLEIMHNFTYNKESKVVIDIDRFPPIYYNFNNSNIRIDAAKVLDYVSYVMNKYPSISVKANSHTDARGNTASNQFLSENRGRSVVDYLISNGISSDRISSQGYGESQLSNTCSDGIACSEEEHQANRRTEFVVGGSNSSGFSESYSARDTQDFSVPSQEGMVVHEVFPGETLASIAALYATTIESITATNKDFYVGQELKFVPLGIASSNGSYRVVFGDTLYSLAKNNGLTVAELKDLNNLSDNTIIVGQELKFVSSDVASNNATHRVIAGDTLYSLAKNNGLTVSELKDINNLSDNTIIVGQELNLVPLGVASSNATYKVVAGDTLYSLAKNNDLNVAKLKYINNLSDDRVIIGQVLQLR